MPDQIKFTGAVLKSFTRKPDGGSASFSANYPTESVRNAMGWGDMAPGQTSAKLEGRLAATHASLCPKDGELGKWMIEFDATAVNGFEGIRYEIEGKKNKGHRLELHFKVEFADTTAAAALEAYMTSIGQGKGILTVDYIQQTKMEIQEDKQMSIGDEKK